MDRGARATVRRVMVDHLTLPVGDFGASRHFYLSALSALGYGIVEEGEGEATFGAEDAYDVFSIAAAAGGGPRGGPRRGRAGQRRPGPQAPLPGGLLRRLRLRPRRQQRGGRPPRLGPRPERPP